MGRRKKLAILDHQFEYGIRLADWIQTHYKETTMCFVLRDIDELKKLVMKQPIDVMLIDGLFEEEYKKEWTTDDISESFERQIWWLQEYTPQREQDIYRYQSVPNVLKQIELFANETESNRANDYEATEINCGRNVVLIPLSNSYQLRRKVRDLYGTNQSRNRNLLWFVCVENDAEQQELSEKMLYAIKMKNGSLLNELHIPELDICSEIYPVRYPYDYRELGVEEIKWFLEWINEKNCGCYMYLDVGLLKDEQVLHCFDEIHMLCNQQDQESIVAMDKFLKICGISSSKIKNVFVETSDIDATEKE